MGAQEPRAARYEDPHRTRTYPRTTAVSIVIPSYNHRAFVAAAIESVLDQSFLDLELLVIDDASTDGSDAVIADTVAARVAAGDARVAYRVHDANSGIAATLNEGLAWAGGKYFAYLGSDDLWLPEKLALQVAAMQEMAASRAVGASYGDCYIIDASGEVTDRFGRQYDYVGGRIYEGIVFGRFHPPSPTNLFVTEIVKKVGGFDTDNPIEDKDLWVRVAREFDVAYIPSPVACFRLHDHNTSRQRIDLMVASNEMTITKAVAADPALRPHEGRLRTGLLVGRAAAAYLAGDLPTARRMAVAALRREWRNRVAWRVLLRSLLGRRIVALIRERRARLRKVHLGP